MSYDISYLQKLKELTESARHASILQLNTGEAPNHILDLGCGPGSSISDILAVFQDHPHIFGVDICHKMIDYCKGNFTTTPKCYFYQSDSATLEFDDNFFDASRSERLFQHLESPIDTLLEMKRVTAPGGAIVNLDVDWSTLSIHTSDKQMEKKIVTAITDNTCVNGRSGSILPDLYDQASILDTTYECFSFNSTDIKIFKLFVFDSFKEQNAINNWISADLMDSFTKDIELKASSNSFSVSITQILAKGISP